MIGSFLAGTAYTRPFTVQAAWNISSSFHFTLWSLSLVFTEVPILLCTTRLFKRFTLENNLYVWMSLNVQAQNWVLQPWPDIPIQLGNPQHLTCASGSSSFWVPVNLLQAMGDATSRRVEVPTSSWLLLWLARVWAAAPLFLQSIWSRVAEQDPAPVYLETQSRLRQIRFGKWGCEATAWAGKSLPATQAWSVFT